MIKVYIVSEAIEQFKSPTVVTYGYGACVEFSGVIRPDEAGKSIAGIEFEVYADMAEKVMRDKLEGLQKKYGFIAAEVIHRAGKVSVSEAAIRVRIWSAHRREAFAASEEFMNQLKKEVPIWKVGTY